MVLWRQSAVKKGLAMKFMNLRSWFAFAGWLSLLELCSAGAGSPVTEGGTSLPFTVAVTNVTPASLPEYLDPYGKKPPSGQIADYPMSPVVIDGELWVIHKNGYSDKIIRYKGPDIENMVRQPDGKLNPDNPTYGKVVHPYMLGRMWYDAEGKKLYAPLHCEYKAPTSGPGIVLRQVHLASSEDKGLTWKFEGPLLTGDTSIPPLSSSGIYWDGGDGDFYLYVDERGGYIYIFTTYYLWPKPGVNAPYFMRHRVARCKISDKMAPGKWMRWYNGAWNEPGIGGKSSYVDAHVIIYSTYLGKYLSFNYGSGLAACTDLSKQDWTPNFFIPGDCWGTQKNLEITTMDEGKTNTWVFDRTLYIYTYLQGWNAGPGHVYRLDFGPGAMPDTNGFVGWGAGVDAKKFFDADWEGRPATDPLRPYGAPSYDNADPVESRRTRRVECSSAEVVRTGDWKPESSPFAAIVGKAAQDSISLTFKGAGIYWRAAQGPDCGKADVLLDGVLQKTVDCYGIHAPHRFWFVKTGLDPSKPHTVRIVVRGEKNPKSTGTAIRHLSFEYEAESTRASDGFSGVMGKNGWNYLALEGAEYGKLEFSADNTWQKYGAPAVGTDWQIFGDAWSGVRQWIAPHAGTVRLEGVVTGASGDVTAATAQILHEPAAGSSGKAVEVWASGFTSTKGQDPVHDVTVTVNAGDAVTFKACRPGQKTGQKTAEAGGGLVVLANTGGIGHNQVYAKEKKGAPLRIGTNEFARGLYCHAPSKVIVRLPGPGKKFSALAGVDAGNDAGVKGSVVFSVSAGGKNLFKSGLLKGKMEAVPVDVDLGGARDFIIEAGDGGDGFSYDWSDWAEARVTLADGREIWLGDLPVEDQRSALVHWDPAVTYVPRE